MRKRCFVTTLILFCFLYQNIAQTIDWERNYGGTAIDRVRQIQKTSDGGYIFAGSSLSDDIDIVGNKGNYDFWVEKLDALGNIQWGKNYGGTGGDEASSIIPTSDGGYIIAGSTKSRDGDVSNHHGINQFEDCWIVKINHLGDLEWEKNYGGYDPDRATSIIEIEDGYIFLAYTNSDNVDVSSNQGGEDAWIVKINFTGEIVWEKTFGGTSHEYPSQIMQTLDGGFLVLAVTYSENGDITNSYGMSDVWIVKLNNMGEMEWQKTFGGSHYESIGNIIQNATGEYVFVGSSRSNDGMVKNNNGDYDAWLVKIDEFGELLWEKNFGGTLSDIGTEVYSTVDGKYIVVGYTRSNDGDVNNNYGESDAWIVQLNESGMIEWEKTFGGTLSDGFSHVISHSNGKYLLAGFSLSDDIDVSNNYGQSDVWIAQVHFNSFTTSDASTTTTSREVIDTEFYVEVVPNPSNGNFSIAIPEMDKDYQVKIFDVIGNQVEFSINNNNEVRMKGLTKGVYFISLTYQGFLITRKIIVN